MNQLTLITARLSHTIIGRVLSASYKVLVIGIKCKGCLELQARCYHFQVLFQLEERLQLTSCSSIIALLCTLCPRISTIGTGFRDSTI